MRPILVVALVAIAAFQTSPAVGAECQHTVAGDACVVDASSGDPGCGSFGSSGHGQNSVYVGTVAGAGAAASASRACWNDAGGNDRAREIGASAWAPYAGASAQWRSWSYQHGGSGCQTLVQVSASFISRAHDLGCPAGGPPDAPWGQLLP